VAFLDRSKRYSRLLKKASLVGAFFVSAIWLTAANALCPAPASLPLVQVQRVVDGDTLRLKDGRSVRMIGLNAPETAKKGKPSEPFADTAQRRLQALVDGSGGQVLLRVGEQRNDRYGRTLANVYSRNGANLEAQLIAEGLGYLVAFSPNVALVECQQAAERSARQGRLGIWRTSPVRSASQIKSGGFAVVSGRVSQVKRNGGGVWIEFQNSLVLRIAPNLVNQFDADTLQRLKGRHVEARGWVVDRSRREGLKAGQARWMISLTHPAMLNTISK
jgi:endonuclease YncB( thermonuclease family)